jgi:hypothetical protein
MISLPTPSTLQVLATPSPIVRNYDLPSSNMVNRLLRDGAGRPCVFIAAAASQAYRLGDRA